MIPVTLSIIEGLERGRIYDGLASPITIGREEDNDVQLNDERVSRIHAKIQEDHGQVILTDLNSTNGSRVNGHPVQLRVLQPGDHLQIGRCTLLYGSDEEIEDRARHMGIDVAALSPLKHSRPLNGSHPSPAPPSASQDLYPGTELNADNLQLPLFPGGQPGLPDSLAPGQRARLSDMLSYVHERMRDVTFEGQEVDEAREGEPLIAVPWQHWQNMLLLQRDLAEWLQQIADPDSE